MRALLSKPSPVSWVLPALLVVGAIARLLLISNDGFKIDVADFEYWAKALAERPFSQFYGSGGVADYPPGYLYILAAGGGMWELFFKHVDANGDILKCLIKVPAIIADLLIGVLLYRLVLRFSSKALALGTAALYLLSPPVILISAMWGQVDAISGGLGLLGLYLLLKSEDGTATTHAYIVAAWLSLGFAVLIKPQTEVVLGLLFIAFAFANEAQRRQRLSATAVGIACAFVMAIALSAPFHPTWNIADLFVWLLQRYAHGANVYQYTSINAFNLWTIRHAFWQPEGVTFGIPQFWLGMGLTLATAALVIRRYLGLRTAQALVESSALVTLAFFMFFTRMHERHVFDGVLLTIACIGFARRYLIAAIVLSAVLWANLDYSLYYLKVLNDHLPGNGQDLWGAWDHVLSLVNVATLLWLGCVFLMDQNRRVVSRQA